MSRSFTDNVSLWFGALGASLKSVFKMLVLSRRVEITALSDINGPLVILGNGPSLRRNLDKDMSVLQQSQTLAVNFAANAPEFKSLRPDYYVLADPHFFDHTDDPNVARLLSSINGVDWPMTLFLPVKARSARRFFNNSNLRFGSFNFLAVEGFGWLEKKAFSCNRGMPRPRNVLIPSIMVGLAMGYRELYLLGADHSWMQTISVNEDNEVVSVQPHFYKEDERELARIRTDYLKRPLHEVLQSFYTTFRSYHVIRRYADEIGAKIYNATPDSFIDAFERRSLPGTQL